MSENKFRTILARYVPPGAETRLAVWLVQNKANLNITLPRSSVLGSYRSPRTQKGIGHRITINGNLSSYQFLITLVHEMAHLLVWERYNKNGKRVAPHGPEWKSAFQELMQPFLQPAFFPPDVLAPLEQMMQDPPSTTMGHKPLWEALARYKKDKNGQTYRQADTKEAEAASSSASPVLSPYQRLLRDVPEQVPFAIKSPAGFRVRVFKKIKLLRSHYLCEELGSGDHFSIHPQTIVELLPEDLEDY